MGEGKEFRMNSGFQRTLLLILIAFHFQAFAQEEEQPESFIHWDRIVTELKSDLNSTRTSVPEPSYKDDYGMDNIRISLGMGMSFSHISVQDPALKGSGLLNGVGFQFGIDLFHPEFQAEGAFRNYSSNSLSDSVKAQVREFELRLVHSKPLAHHTHFRMGAGLSARYLDISSRSGIDKDETVPSAAFLLGLGRTFGNSISIGPDITYRSPMSGESIEKSSFDLHLRANAIF